MWSPPFAAVCKVKNDDVPDVEYVDPLNAGRLEVEGAAGVVCGGQVLDLRLPDSQLNLQADQLFLWDKRCASINKKKLYHNQ